MTSDLASLYFGDSNPYDDFETIDDTQFPLAHGQLLPHLSDKVHPHVIFELGQGNIEFCQYIEDSATRDWAWNQVHSLGEAGAFGDNWGAEIDFPELDSPELDSPELDSPELDSPELDSPELDSLLPDFAEGEDCNYEL